MKTDYAVESPYSLTDSVNPKCSVISEKAGQAGAKQFEFGRHWRKKIVPYLNDRRVEVALTIGLKLVDPNYAEGDPPWLVGRGPLNGQRARKGCLSWYQPWGQCHGIAPFCWALGRMLYPKLNWGFVTGKLHTVIVGCTDDWNQPELVMDILQFKSMTAAESLSFAKDVWRFCSSFGEYIGTFCNGLDESHKEALTKFNEVVEQKFATFPNAESPSSVDSRPF